MQIQQQFMNLYSYSIFLLKKFDHDETRTRNLLIRSQTPYPLGHAVLEELCPIDTIRT